MSTHKYKVFDSHCDTPKRVWSLKQDMETTDGHVSLPQARELAGYGQFFAFCTSAGLDKNYTCEQLLWEPYRYFKKLLEVHADSMELCTKGADFDRVTGAGKVAAYLSLEGAEGISCDPGRLDELREAGLTMVGLNWNGDNALSGCAMNDGPGLSAQGREFVRRAQKLGIIIDLSHASDKTFWDVMDITEKPVITSHSNSRTHCGHWRNLTDDMFKALCDCGGFTGINLYGLFLNDGPTEELEDIYIHMDHFLQLGGDGHICLGGDLDGCDHLPRGFEGVRDYNKVADYLEGKGFSCDTIEDIFCNTMKKVVTECIM